MTMMCSATVAEEKKENLSGSITVRDDSEIKTSNFSIHNTSSGESLAQSIKLRVDAKTVWCNESRVRVDVPGKVKTIDDWELLDETGAKISRQIATANPIPGIGPESVWIKPGRGLLNIIHVRVLVQPGNSPSGVPDTEAPQHISWETYGSKNPIEVWSTMATGELQSSDGAKIKALGDYIEGLNSQDKLTYVEFMGKPMLINHADDMKPEKDSIGIVENKEILTEFTYGKYWFGAGTKNRAGESIRARSFWGKITANGRAHADGGPGNIRGFVRVDNSINYGTYNEIVKQINKVGDSIQDINFLGVKIPFLQRWAKLALKDVAEVVSSIIANPRLKMTVGATFGIHASVEVEDASGNESPSGSKKGFELNVSPGYVFDSTRRATFPAQHIVSKDMIIENSGGTSRVGTAFLSNSVIHAIVAAKYSTETFYVVPGFTAALSNSAPGIAYLYVTQVHSCNGISFSK